MGYRQMQVFHGPQAEKSASPSEKQVKISLGDICELLADAQRSGLKWLSDFTDEEVGISPDLYDVLMAYRYYRSAAELS